MSDNQAGAKRTLSLGELPAPIWRATPRASSNSPEANRQLLATCTRPSACRLYWARVLLAHLRWNQLGNLAISYQVPM